MMQLRNLRRQRKKPKKLEEIQSKFVSSWSSLERKKSYSDLKDNHLKQYFKLSMIKKNLKSVYKSTRYQRDQKNVLFRNSVLTKITQINVHNKKHKMEKRKSIEIEQKMRETKKETKFYFKKSINHEYEEEQKKLFKVNKVSHDEFQRFINSLRQKYHKKYKTTINSEIFYYNP